MYFWENEKVRLRMVETSDSSFFIEYLKDTMGRLQPDHGIALPATVQTAEDMAEFAVQSTGDGEELWFAILNHQGEMTGYAVIDWMNERMGNTQLGINIFEKFRRCGYATYAAKILLEYIFHERRFHKLACCVLEGNDAGNAFVKSLGMALDGFRDEMFYTHGKYIGEYYYSLLDYEYNEGIKQREKYDLPDSEIGKLSEKFLKFGKLVQKPEKPGSNGTYFWKYDGIVLRDMTEEDYLKNHDIIFDTGACVFYDSDVKLPMVSKELSEYEKSHLNFNCDDDRIEFAICNEEDEYVGNINICGMDRKNGKFSYSIYVLNEHRGNGYATKALRLILWYCFQELRMNKMICGVNEGNHSSAAVMRKVGCRVEGVLRENEYYHGQFIDMICFGVKKDEFMAFNHFDE